MPVDSWKGSDSTEVDCLTGVFTNAMKEEEVLRKWRNSTSIPTLKKKGGIQDCSSYRGINLTSHILRIWERIMDRRLMEKESISGVCVYPRQEYHRCRVRYFRVAATDRKVQGRRERVVLCVHKRHTTGYMERSFGTVYE